MKYTKIYIGSNNETGELELAKIHWVLQMLGNCGYTLTQGKGYWQGKTENTAVIEIYGNYNTGIIPELKQELGQNSILVAESITEVNYND
jgi:hypothetical protein